MSCMPKQTLLCYLIDVLEKEFTYTILQLRKQDNIFVTRNCIVKVLRAKSKNSKNWNNGMEIPCLIISKDVVYQ